MLILRLDARFGAFRTFTAGSFRPTAPFITPSAAYGLLLNIAGIDMRYNDGKSVATLTQSKGLPSVDIALGVRGELPRQQSILQQQHNYPVGASGKAYKAMARGNKHNITPVRRAFLSGIHAYIALRADESLEKQVVKGLQGEVPRAYGLPFIGDNSFLPDRLEVVEMETLEPAHWYERIDKGKKAGLRADITRLTIRIDRVKMGMTKSSLFFPQQQASKEIPKRAWVSVAY
ncbi:Type I-MYXAN CRISPR-associated protein Cas5/Cmx5/DevS [Candidatus Electrothrix laxa]